MRGEGRSLGLKRSFAYAQDGGVKFTLRMTIKMELRMTIKKREKLMSLPFNDVKKAQCASTWSG
jgi:hypothetical protein